MRLLPPGWRLTALLVLCCVGLAALLVVQWRGQTPLIDPRIVPERADPVPTSEAGGPAPPLPPSSRSGPPALATFDEILERPLFSPERRPAQAPEPEAPPPMPVEPLNLRLEGIAKVGESRIAVLRDLQTNQGLRLSEGMEYNGWRVQSVDPEVTVLTRDGQVQEIRLERKDASGFR